MGVPTDPDAVARSPQPATPLPVLVRHSTEADIPAITDIYEHHVLYGYASFEEEAPTAAEMAARRAATLSRGQPHLVAELDGKIMGYAYVGPYRLRSAYRFTVEDSIYVRREAVGNGVGRALLAELITRCTVLGYRQMIAVIGDSGNSASIRLHARLGFVHTGTVRAIGWKHGRWVDSVMMQLALGDGAAAPPVQDRPRGP